MSSALPEPSSQPTAVPRDPAPAPVGIARSATLLAIGSIASRVLGLLREVVIATWFGASGLVSAFTVASIVPTMLYDFLIGGMLSAALVPVLSDYARPEKRVELTRLVGALVSLLAVTLAALVLLLQIFAPQVAWLLGGGFARLEPELLPLTVRLIRLIAPSVWFFSMAGLLTAVLYALQRFTFPAVATAIYNLGIVIAAPLLAERLGVTSLVIGVLVGSGAQFAIMAWDVHRAGLRFHLQWSHPALGRIARLYLPIAAGLVVAQFQVGLDRRLASGTDVQAIAWMRSATTLQQLPLGLISVAVSLAALPMLSRYFAAGQEAHYRATVGRGLRTVLVLIAPVLVALYILAEPTIRLLFEGGAFTPTDTMRVAAALRIYLIGAFFAAIDFPLNYAFYARNNTLLPALVGVVSVGVYAAVAFSSVAPLGYIGLVWADTAKHAGHALIMVILLLWTVGPVQQLGRALLSVGLGAVSMVAAMRLLLPHAARLAERLPETAADLLLMAGLGASGLIVYVAVLGLLRSPELRQLRMRLSGTRG